MAETVISTSATTGFTADVVAPTAVVVRGRKSFTLIAAAGVAWTALIRRRAGTAVSFPIPATTPASVFYDVIDPDEEVFVTGTAAAPTAVSILVM